MSKIERVKQIISKQTGADLEVIDEHSTFEQLAIDGLDAVDIIMTVEEEFDVLFASDTEIRGLDDIMQYI